VLAGVALWLYKKSGRVQSRRWSRQRVNHYIYPVVNQLFDLKPVSSNGYEEYRNGREFYFSDTSEIDVNFSPSLCFCVRQRNTSHFQGFSCIGSYEHT